MENILEFPQGFSSLPVSGMACGINPYSPMTSVML